MLAHIIAQDGSKFDMEFTHMDIPTIVFQEVRVKTAKGGICYIAGSHQWLPIGIEAKTENDYQKLIEASPFEILATIGEQTWHVEQGWLMDEGDQAIPAPVFYKQAFLIHSE